MHLDTRLRALIHERADAPCLRAGEVLADDAPRGEIDRKLLVYRIAALAIRGHEKSRLPVRVKKPSALEQPGRARVFESRARPEHAHLPVDSLVGNAVVIGNPSAGRFPQLVENFA